MDSRAGEPLRGVDGMTSTGTDRAISLLTALGELLRTNVDRSPPWREILRTIVSQTGVDFASLWIVDAEKGCLRQIETLCDRQPVQQSTERMNAARLAGRGEGLVGSSWLAGTA
ncbi:MAG TPA: hypothetical protein VEJ87_12005, partial [Acidimicrobiales bacterium]|nr:hypothetical protein [Acidimicrobiales bacterium]